MMGDDLERLVFYILLLIVFLIVMFIESQLAKGATIEIIQGTIVMIKPLEEILENSVWRIEDGGKYLCILQCLYLDIKWRNYENKN